MSETEATEVIDAEVIEPPGALVPRPALAVTPAVQAEELVERLAVIKKAMELAMQEGVDYGRIPGVDKPTLFKPGAEKLGVLFQLDIQIRNEKTWGPGEHLTVISHATVFHAPTGARLGYGEGLATTREKKHAKRTADRSCPQCGAAAIKRSKFPPRDNPGAEPGWYCFGKIGGCGANYAADDQAIIGQRAGEIENPELPDSWNPVVKMAAKRARVDAVLAVTGASALFTQDAEDLNHPEPPQPSGTQPVAAPPQNAPRPASAKQRGLINAKAGQAGLSMVGLANAILAAANQETREFETEDRAKAFVDRQLDRLPANLVDAVLERITEQVPA